MHRIKRLFILTICMAIGVILGVAFTLKVDQKSPTFENSDEELLVSALRRVSNSYIDSVSREELVDGAIKGMVDVLDDEQSDYFTGAGCEQLIKATSYEYAGIGAEVTFQNDAVILVALLTDSPAAVAGLRSGDRIVAVDHQPIKNEPLKEVAAKLRGKQGTSVHVAVQRHMEDEPIGFDIVRDTIVTPIVTSRMLKPGYGYLHITQFLEPAQRDVFKAIQELNNGDGLSGLIIDLRNNPGGLLTEAVGISGLFLDAQIIVRVEARNPSDSSVYESKPGDILEGIPIAILINGNTASAAELVAGTLQDHSRATLLGTNSFGKGSIQSLLIYSGGHTIKLTTARYILPKSGLVLSDGIDPDILFEEEIDPRLIGTTLDPLVRRAIEHLKSSPQILTRNDD